MKAREYGKAATDTDDMKANFDKLVKNQKHDLKTRMKTLHSYNILDNPDYIESKKIEKRILRYYGARH